MNKTHDILKKLGLPARDAYDLPTSTKRFPDGASYRVEIPSCEGPKAMAAVIAADGTDTHQLFPAGTSGAVEWDPRGELLTWPTEDASVEVHALDAPS